MVAWCRFGSLVSSGGSLVSSGGSLVSFFGSLVSFFIVKVSSGVKIFYCDLVWVCADALRKSMIFQMLFWEVWLNL